MRFALTYFFVFFVFFAFPQNNIFDFANLSFSSRSSSMGGDLINIYDDDVNIAVVNPSCLNSNMNNKLSFSFIDYYTDINYFSSVFVTDINDFGSFCFGFFGVNYGDFIESDETGNVIGSFKAGEYMFTIGSSKKILKKLYLGSNFKFLYSNLYNISSTAVSSDLSFFYKSDLSNFTLLFRNMGTTIKSYNNNNNNNMPFKIQLGVSNKLKYLPLRFSFIYDNIQDFNHLNSELNSELNFLNKLFSHFIIGAEFGKDKFKIRGGYNVKRRYELSYIYPGFSGFSWGLGLRIKDFELDYSRSTYHVYGSPNYFTISTNLSKILKFK